MYLEENRNIPRIAGAILGACVAVVVVVMALPSAGSGGVLPATVDLSVRSGGAVAAAPAAPNVVLHAANLRPGNGAALARFDLDNEAGRPAMVSFEAVPTSTELDSLARISVRLEGRRVLDATIGELRQGALGAVALRPGEQRTLLVTARIPVEIETGYEGRKVGVELVPVAREGRQR